METRNLHLKTELQISDVDNVYSEQTTNSTLPEDFRTDVPSDSVFVSTENSLLGLQTVKRELGRWEDDKLFLSNLEAEEVELESLTAVKKEPLDLDEYSKTCHTLEDYSEDSPAILFSPVVVQTIKQELGGVEGYKKAQFSSEDGALDPVTGISVGAGDESGALVRTQESLEDPLAGESSLLHKREQRSRKCKRGPGRNVDSGSAETMEANLLPPNSAIVTSGRKGPGDVLADNPRKRRRLDKRNDRGEEVNIRKLQTRRETPRENPFSCKDCGRDFNSSRGLASHSVRKHLKERPFQCQECGYSCPTSVALKSHMWRHHGSTRPIERRVDSFKCNLCGQCFKIRRQFLNHLDTHVSLAASDKFICKECGSSFSNINFIRRHFKITHGVKTFACDKCDAAFKEPKSLKRHKLSYLGQSHRVYTCDICNTHCDSYQARCCHIQRYHPSSSGDRRTCEKCFATFRIKFDLRNHIRFCYSGGKGYPCNKCGRKYYLRESLTRHIKNRH